MDTQHSERHCRTSSTERPVPQALLFTGIPGIGKRLVAQELSRKIICERANLQESEREHLRSVFDAGNSPDLFFVQCEDKEQWNTQSVRDLLYSFHLTSFSGGDRVVIFDNAESMTVQAVNALLKILEEPPAGLHFVLITANQTRLLPTLLSRCQVWFFSPLVEREIEQILEQQPELVGGLEAELNDFQRREIAVMVDGSMEFIEDIATNLELWEHLKSNLVRISQGELADGMEYARALAKDKASLPRLLRLMRAYARFAMHNGVQAADQRRWACFLQNIISAEYFILERNFGAAYVLEQIFLYLARAQDYPGLTGGSPILDTLAV